MSGGGDVTPRPDFHEVVGEEGTPEELAQLRRVHDLLISADAPPELSRRLAGPPRIRARLAVLPRSRVQAMLGLAAAAAIALGFGIGYSVRSGGGFSASFTRPMHGVGQLAAANASIEIGKRDASGNWPLRMVVRGLPALPRGGWYELYLTKKGKPHVTCGTFKTAGGVANVRLTAPYDLRAYDGWIVTAHVPGARDRVLLST